MQGLYVFLGILIYFGVLYDIVKTTLSMEGGGWLTNLISRGFWRSLLELSGRNPKSPILNHSGYILLISIIGVWVLALWGSFFLLLLSYPSSVINNTTHVTAGVWEKLYYAGFILTTTGVGDFVANTNLWRIISDIFSATGLVFITMSITYFVPVLSAVITQRQLGLAIGSLGSTPIDMLMNGYHNKNFKNFIKQITKFSNILFKHSQNHRAYPVIHYFHNTQQNNAVILQIAKLYEALLIFEHAVKEELHPPPLKLVQIKKSLENYIEVVAKVDNLKVRNREQPQIYLQPLKNQPFMARMDIELSSKIKEQRLILLKLIQNGGWDWKTIYNVE